MDTYHRPVLLQEVLSFLKVENEKKYIDATFGGGGHAFEILRRGGKVLGIDVDQDAIDYVFEKIKNWERLTLMRGNFKDIGKIALENGFENAAGVLFDLGVSSYQLDTQKRGFSFQNSGPLDMRMNKELSVTAEDLVNGLTKRELYELFNKYGEERFARPFSESIVRARLINKITTTGDLARIIKETVRGNIEHGRAVHPATRAFQALRIAVNDELYVLDIGISQAVELLEQNGRLIVISFHSLEDRIVKKKFDNFAKDGKGNVLTKKPITPSMEEITRNRRSRSAKMRVFQKT